MANLAYLSIGGGYPDHQSRECPALWCALFDPSDYETVIDRGITYYLGAKTTFGAAKKRVKLILDQSLLSLELWKLFFPLNYFHNQISNYEDSAPIILDLRELVTLHGTVGFMGFRVGGEYGYEYATVSEHFRRIATEARDSNSIWDIVKDIGEKYRETITLDNWKEVYTDSYRPIWSDYGLPYVAKIEENDLLKHPIHYYLDNISSGRFIQIDEAINLLNNSPSLQLTPKLFKKIYVKLDKKIALIDISLIESKNSDKNSYLEARKLYLSSWTGQPLIDYMATLSDINLGHFSLFQRLFPLDDIMLMYESFPNIIIPRSTPELLIKAIDNSHIDLTDVLNYITSNEKDGERIARIMFDYYLKIDPHFAINFLKDTGIEGLRGNADINILSSGIEFSKILKLVNTGNLNFSIESMTKYVEENQNELSSIFLNKMKESINKNNFRYFPPDIQNEFVLNQIKTNAVNNDLLTIFIQNVNRDNLNLRDLFEKNEIDFDLNDKYPENLNFIILKELGLQKWLDLCKLNERKYRRLIHKTSSFVVTKFNDVIDIYSELIYEKSDFLFKQFMEQFIEFTEGCRDQLQEILQNNLTKCEKEGLAIPVSILQLILQMVKHQVLTRKESVNVLTRVVKIQETFKIQNSQTHKPSDKLGLGGYLLDDFPTKFCSAFIETYKEDGLTQDEIAILLENKPNPDETSLLMSLIDTAQDAMQDKLVLRQLSSRPNDVDLSSYDDAGIERLCEAIFKEYLNKTNFDFIDRVFSSNLNSNLLFCEKLIVNTAHWANKAYLLEKWTHLVGSTRFTQFIESLFTDHICGSCQKSSFRFLANFPDISINTLVEWVDKSEIESKTELLNYMINKFPGFVPKNDILSQINDVSRENLTNVSIDHPFLVYDLRDLTILEYYKPSATQFWESKFKSRQSDFEYILELSNKNLLGVLNQNLEQNQMFAFFIIELMNEQMNKSLLRKKYLIEYITHVKSRIQNYVFDAFEIEIILNLDDNGLLFSKEQENAWRVLWRIITDYLIRLPIEETTRLVPFISQCSSLIARKELSRLISVDPGKAYIFLNPDELRSVKPNNLNLFQTTEIKTFVNPTIDSFLHLRELIRDQFKLTKELRTKSILSVQVLLSLSDNPTLFQANLPSSWLKKDILSSLQKIKSLYDNFKRNMLRIKSEDEIIDLVRDIPSIESLYLIGYLLERNIEEDKIIEINEILINWALRQDQIIIYLLSVNSHVFKSTEAAMKLTHFIYQIRFQENNIIQIFINWMRSPNNTIRGICKSLILREVQDSPLRTKILGGFYSPILSYPFLAGMWANYEIALLHNLREEWETRNYRGRLNRQYHYTPSNATDLRCLGFSHHVMPLGTISERVFKMLKQYEATFQIISRLQDKSPEPSE